MLWKKVTQGLSAGRVQSVATRLVVERERERIAFVAAAYWDLEGIFDPGSFDGAARRGRRQARRARPRLRRGRQAQDRQDSSRLDEDAGARARSSASTSATFSGPQRGREAVHAPADRAVHDLDAAAGGEPQAALHVADDDARRAAPVRERLHHLHAHRLDDALRGGGRGGARAGDASSTAPTTSRRSRGATTRKVKNAQEAHEAIRPAGDCFRTPNEVRGELNRDELALYELIWKRTIASQMADARGQTVSLRLGATSVDRRGRRVRRLRHRDHVPRLPRRLRGGQGRRGRRREPASAAAPRGRPGRRDEGADRAGPRDVAAAALHRGDARARARGARHRPPVDVRRDHGHDPRPRLRLQARHRARPVVSRVLGHRVCSRSTSAASSTTSSPRAWRTTSTASRPATRAASSGCGASTSATATEATRTGLKALVDGARRDRRARGQHVPDRRRTSCSGSAATARTSSAARSARACRPTSRPTSSRSRRRRSSSRSRRATATLGVHPETGRADRRARPAASART